MTIRARRAALAGVPCDDASGLVRRIANWEPDLRKGSGYVTADQVSDHKSLLEWSAQDFGLQEM
jgi:hypothetical protein